MTDLRDLPTDEALRIMLGKRPSWRWSVKAAARQLWKIIGSFVIFLTCILFGKAYWIVFFSAFKGKDALMALGTCAIPMILAIIYLWISARSKD